MRPYILIPCKSLTDGKSRLATILPAAERQALCRRLLRNSLALALALQSVGGVRVVTPDPEAGAIAAALGVAMIDDGGAGLNEALHRARAGILDESGGEAAVLILPIDLPYATADAVSRAIAGDFDIVVAPDSERRGTNLLYVGSRALRAFSFAFGPDSFPAHWNWAKRTGFSVETLDDPRLAFDVDRPEDYERWQRATAGASG